MHSQVPQATVGKVQRRDRKPIAVGASVPSVPLASTAGRVIDVSEEGAERNVVLLFYPGDREGLKYPELIGCTPEACSFRDRLDEFERLSARVFGVSFQSTKRQQGFQAAEGLGFELLSDSEGQLAEALGIPLWESDVGELYVTRTTVVLARGPAIAQIFPDVKIEGHVDDVLAFLTTLAEDGNAE